MINWGCFANGGRHGKLVSLNRYEQELFNYADKHPEERQYWMHKVRSMAQLWSDPHLAAERLEQDLWRYFLERSTVVPQLKDFVRSQGVNRTSMRNLAEYFLRMWGPAKPKKTVEGSQT